MNKNTEISGIELKILILEDSLPDMILIREQLIQAGYLLDITHVDNERDFSNTLQNDRFNIILSDFSLPGFNAFGALHIRNEICPETPFICVSGSIGEETAIELLKLGAVDYVLKDRPERLPFSVKRALDEAKENIAYQKAAKALQESEHRFKQVAEEAQEWIWEVDTDGLYTYASPVCYTLLGYTPEEIVRKKYFYDFFPPDEKENLKSNALKVFADRKSFSHFENPNIHKDGRVLMLTTSGSPIINENGKFLGYRGVDSDITERKRTEQLILKINEELEQKVNDRTQELTEANKKLNESNATKDKFFSIIAHDLKNPFNSILVHAQLLLMNFNKMDSEKILKSIRYISGSAENAYNLLENLLEWSRSQTGKIQFTPQETSLDYLFKTALESTINIAAHKKINIELESTNDITLYADKNMLNTVLRNLITNAIKFTPSGGKITLMADVNKERLVISVADTGVGIPQDIIQKLFKITSKVSMPGTENEPGTGLGLILCKEFVEKHAGNIYVKSEEGKGSVFSFNIPLKQKII